MTGTRTGLEALDLYGQSGLCHDRGHGLCLGPCPGDDHASALLGHYHLVVRLALSSCLREKGPSLPSQFAKGARQRRRC